MLDQPRGVTFIVHNQWYPPGTLVSQDGTLSVLCPRELQSPTPPRMPGRDDIDYAPPEAVRPSALQRIMAPQAVPASHPPVLTLKGFNTPRPSRLLPAEWRQHEDDARAKRPRVPPDATPTATATAQDDTFEEDEMAVDVQLSQEVWAYYQVPGSPADTPGDMEGEGRDAGGKENQGVQMTSQASETPATSQKVSQEHSLVRRLPLLWS
jgi:hypothetical protein